MPAEQLITDPVHTPHDDEYFDGNDVKTYGAQSGKRIVESYQEMRDRERAEAAAQPEPDVAEASTGDPVEDVYREKLAEFNGDEDRAREWAENYREGLKMTEEASRQQQEAQDQEDMQAIAADVVARHDEKVERLEDAKDDVEEAFGDSPQVTEIDSTEAPGITEAGRQWVADRMPQSVETPQEQVDLPRPLATAESSPAPNVGMFERRRLDASKSLMSQMANAASELAKAPGLTEEERAKYAEDAKRYSDSVTDLVMGQRPSLSRAELKGNRGSLEKLEDKLLKNKNERGLPLSKDEKKRLSKIK